MIVANNRGLIFVVALLMLFATVALGRAAPKPVPPSPYLGVAYRFADAMLKQGRDTQGRRKTGLLLSALDRTTLSVLTDRPDAPAGIAESSRAGGAEGPLVGANPQHDQNLLRVLYTLSELSSKPVYRDAADAELKWFLEHGPSADAPIAAWDEGATWNMTTNSLLHVGRDAAQGPMRPWMLWDRCFEIAPEASKRLVMGLKEASADGTLSPRRAGSSIRAFAVAYQHTGDEAWLKVIEAALERLEKLQSEQGGHAAQAGPRGPASGRDDSSAAAWLSAAIDCDGAARLVPVPLATRLQAFAARADRSFCALPHDLQGKGGFAIAQGPSTEKADAPMTSLWQVGPDGQSTAQVAMMCVSRYENTGRVGFRKLIQSAAEAYRDKLPPADVDAWPMTYGQAISLQLAAWRATSRQEYLDRARTLADAAVQTFWGDSPLPRASSKSNHYESITGSDTLTLALVELHLSILGITAVRTPPNTIDR
jgi:hypothetical protein